MTVLGHLEEVLTRVLGQRTSGSGLWEPLGVAQSRPQAWLCTQPDSSWTGHPLAWQRGLQKRDVLSEEGGGMIDPQEFHTPGRETCPPVSPK